ncbi:hypothetical protein [Blastococcus xanthinilyticus]|uniref:Uncharacterized protein n=1 Tax=Blastococcus xanthinilyticus TaxID=1564164 RepID=A0A5S5CZQ0_9ACTN|nr:hypothetical protein [Blastococcus xanthinilyticus]TYP88564.1 hypothetical protein BD833_104272 [Blastococcus xanthinilyticus]
MVTYRATVTYTIDVVDEAALLRAGAEAWAASAGGWAVRVEHDGGVVEATAEESAAVTPGPEPSIAFVLGRAAHPVVPGARFTGSSVDVAPVPPG